MTRIGTTRMVPAALTATHLGSYVVAEESAGQIAGGLSDVQQCPPRPDWDVLAGQQAIVVPVDGDEGCPLLRLRTDGHTHLWLGGQLQVISHDRGRVYVTAPVVPTDRPGGTQ